MPGTCPEDLRAINPTRTSYWELGRCLLILCKLFMQMQVILGASYPWSTCFRWFNKPLLSSSIVFSLPWAEVQAWAWAGAKSWSWRGVNDPQSLRDVTVGEVFDWTPCMPERFVSTHSSLQVDRGKGNFSACSEVMDIWENWAAVDHFPGQPWAGAKPACWRRKWIL